MDDCFVTNFYRATYAIITFQEQANGTNPVGYDTNIISPRFVAGSLTTFAVSFSSIVVLLIISRLYRVARRICRCIFAPSNVVKVLGDVGYVNHESYDLSRKQLVNLARRRRKLGLDVPPVYPNGWFRILDSRLLEKGDVKQVRFVGENLVAFRSKSGKVSVLDAYCPHMGANLGVGGRVVDECIECPFHGWKFDGNGKCVDIPYSKREPSYADTKAWHSCERNGNIYVWFHCDKTNPEWEIPSIPELNRFKYGGRSEHHINTHIQDIPENGYDEPHLNHLHLPSHLSGVDLATHFESKFNYISHNVMEHCYATFRQRFVLNFVFTRTRTFKGFAPSLISPIFHSMLIYSGTTDYSEMKETGEHHMAKIMICHHFRVFSSLNLFYIKFRVIQIGPGIVHIFASTPLFDLIIVQSISPVEPMEQVLTHAIYCPRHVPIMVAKLILEGLVVQVDRDLMVWNNRTILGKPRLQKEEKVQKTFRKWFAQFYSENSPKLGDTKQRKILDW